MITDLGPTCNKAYLSAITDKHFFEFHLQDGGKNQLAEIWNKITSLSRYMYMEVDVYACSES